MQDGGFVSEEAIIRAILKGTRLPKEVQAFDFRFADDSTGQPAVWVNLHVKDDLRPTPEKIERLTTVRKVISEKILAKQLTRLPYVQLVTD
jgi:hypothetical protein